jgi:DNA-binding NtrC family response regulator
VVTGDALEVADLGSSNGTFVGARRVTREPVAAGERLAFGHVALTVEWVAEEDLVPALSIAVEPSPHRPEVASELSSERATVASTPPAGTTLGAQSVDRFALEDFPALVARLVRGDDVVALAQAAGASLHAGLPVVEVEVLEGPDDDVGVLFHARREGGVAAPAEVVAGDDDLRLRVAFAHPQGARVFRRMVEGVGDLLRLAARRTAKRVASASTAEPPPMPEPESVVPAMRQLYAQAARVAQGDVGVLVCGESGTGKELLARFLHAASSRANGPFVALNCAALPRDLLEAELFGIERGVATGVEARAGKFELAHAGTLFLDEIGDMALDTQARILRVLQEREVYRLGGSAPRPAEVRVVAATHRDVRKLLAEGGFRDDLYYRIATWVAELPPLRERRADIPNLAARFLTREATKRGVRVRGISRGALDLLMAYSWPGNVRQLEKEMSRAVLFLADGELLDSARLSPEIREAGASARTSLEAVLERVERREIESALRNADGDVGRAAELLGLGRSTLYRRIKQLGIASVE